MSKINKTTAIKIAKISAFAALCVITAFLIYSVIGYLVVWLSQPRFVGANAVVTSSLGFFIQFVAFGAILLVCVSALIVLGILIFSKKSKFYINKNSEK